jgi:sulfur carrier protein ThiS adenylyltransferase
MSPLDTPLLNPNPRSNPIPDPDPPSHSPSAPSRDVRQRQLVPPERLAACHACVVGVGAIGRQVALQLAAVGVARLDLVDDDVVGVENLAPQAYWHCDVGMPKVEATAEACRLLNPAVELSVHPERFRRSSVRTLPAFAAPCDGDEGSAGKQTVLFCCVDSIATRRVVWEAARGRADFFADGRMSGEVMRVLASGRPAADDCYSTTLFAPERAYAGSCTARSTVYTAGIAAGLMLSAFARWLRGMPPERDLSLNLLSMELAVL